VLGREPAAQHVVRARHDLDADALEVAVQLARGQVHRLAGRELDDVEQERREHADVAGMTAREREDPARGRIAAARARAHASALAIAAPRAPRRASRAPEERGEPSRSGRARSAATRAASAGSASAANAPRSRAARGSG
jgi:hypothetical protein